MTGELLDLSEQQVVSCSTNGYNMGCNGGFEDAALDYITAEGVCLESDYPYTSGDANDTGVCSNSCGKIKLQVGSTVRVNGEVDTIMALNYQPVSVAVEAGNAEWMNYRSGIITQCPGAISDHAVIAVGYDPWSIKIRNSWGADWGEAGHIRLQRGGAGKGTCNVVEFVSFPNIGGVTPKPTPAPTTTTAKPKTTTPQPKPTTTQTPAPRPVVCGSCTQCYYPAASQCLGAEYDKNSCDNYSSTYGTVWCGY
ncbi:hypothetical protein DYB32_007999 [Aphanomyces invadans]|uniref:Peptidase C1A papain C-terminal domain-containing protein n=1 Tax=Aphanomyces invadans TaxID=157072 RepID=A0A3R6Y3X6_9STRA|nr:hypothetical protein DYB32_007999 [Aphanomyces invadans]